MFRKLLGDAFAAPAIAAVFLIVNGFFLFIGDRIGEESVGTLDQLNWKGALAVGCAQCLALIPGISRSGSTIVAGVVAGLKHEESARFSFLMGAPIILAANVYEAPKLLKEGATLGPMAVLSGDRRGRRRLPEPRVPHALFPQARIRGDEPVRLLLLGGRRREPGDHRASSEGRVREGLARGLCAPYMSARRRRTCAGGWRGGHVDHRGHAGAVDARGDRGPEASGRLPGSGEFRAALDRRHRTPARDREPDRARIGAAGGRARKRDRLARRVEARVAHHRPQRRPAKAGNRSHKLAAAVSGALGGAFGLAALLVELPISTTILLRSIAEIAREEGEDLNAPNAAFACVEVFALGGRQDEEAAFESSYFAVRAALAKSVSDCARFVAQQGLGAHSVPVVARLISQIAARFGVVVSEKLAAQAAPILGAIGGATVNAAFADHFQTLARGHFIVRRLEREHGASAWSPSSINA